MPCEKHFPYYIGKKSENLNFKLGVEQNQYIVYTVKSVDFSRKKTFKKRQKTIEKRFARVYNKVVCVWSDEVKGGGLEWSLEIFMEYVCILESGDWY